MAVMSYLVQNTINNTLDLMCESIDRNAILPNDLALSKRFDVSRTTIRTVVDHLCKEDLLKREGTKKNILRRPNENDYFDISGEPSSKEQQFETFFLNLIYSGKLKPGDKFSELDLAKKSNCITITVREFLIRFSRTGLIQKKPRAQWQMVTFDEQFVIELIASLKLLEPASVWVLLERPTNDPIWSELQTLLHQHKHLLENIDEHDNDFPYLDAQLHNLIQNSSNNRFIGQFYEIVTFICHYYYQWDKSDEKGRNIIATQEHIDLINALLIRDISGSITCLEQHLNTAQKTLMKSAYTLRED